MLEAQDLTGRRGFSTLFAGLGLRVLAGEALVVTGPNGRGKTTLLRILAGFTPPWTGTVRWNGTPVAPFAAALRHAVLYIGHAAALKDDLTASENLASLAALSGTRAGAQPVAEALDRVGLAAQRGLPARVLSQGQRRRIGLARLALAVASRPLWILDEPATALDTDAMALLAELSRRHLETGGMLVAATHAPLDLPAPCTRALELA